MELAADSEVELTDWMSSIRSCTSNAENMVGSRNSSYSFWCNAKNMVGSGSISYSFWRGVHGSIVMNVHYT